MRQIQKSTFSVKLTKIPFLFLPLLFPGASQVLHIGSMEPFVERQQILKKSFFPQTGYLVGPKFDMSFIIEN